MSRKEYSTPEKVIYVCTGSKCKKEGGKTLKKLFNNMIKEYDMKGKVEVIKTGCTDRCKFAPNICFQPDNLWFYKVHGNEAQRLFEEIMVKERREKEEDL